MGGACSDKDVLSQCFSAGSFVSICTSIIVFHDIIFIVIVFSDSWLL